MPRRMALVLQGGEELDVSAAYFAGDSSAKTALSASCASVGSIAAIRPVGTRTVTSTEAGPFDEPAIHDRRSRRISARSLRQ